MKQIIILLASLIVTTILNAQQNLTIKQGSTMIYSVTVEGQTFPMYAYIDVFDSSKLSIAWSFESGRSGKFIMGKSSLDSATSGYWNQPIDGQELELPASQNVLFLSKFIYSTLQRNKEALFDNYSVSIKPAAADNNFKLNNNSIDAMCLTSESGARLWVLNNPQTPLILKIENNPYGVDVELLEIN